jgi:hypothetical protein
MNNHPHRVESAPGKTLSVLRIRRFLVMLMICSSVAVGAGAQDLDARSPKPASSGQKQRKAEKKKAKQQAELDKAIRKGKKQHEKLQTKQTKKMMKKSRKKSKRWNDNRREFFLKRWFTPRHRKADACQSLPVYADRKQRGVTSSSGLILSGRDHSLFFASRRSARLLPLKDS